MAREDLDQPQQAQPPGDRAAESAPLADAAPTEGEQLLEESEEALPRDSSVLTEEIPEAEAEEEPDAPTAHQGYAPPAGKRGRRPDPRNQHRRMRTYSDMKMRGATGTAQERADARAFGIAVMDAMRAEGKREAADEFGRREGFLVDSQPAAPTATPAPTAQGAPASPSAGASATAPGAAVAGEPPKPPQPRIHGQPVFRVEGAMHAVAPVVEAMAGLAAACGIDFTQPTTQTFGRGTPNQRQVEIRPRERLTELLAAKLCERSEEAGLVGSEGDEGEDTDLELLMLLGTTVGPVALAVGRKVLSTCASGAVALFNLVRSRRK
jgi:hypothetical protein